MDRSFSFNVSSAPVIVKVRCSIVACAFFAFCTGCSITYYDKTTETTHLWGLGHLKMKATPTGIARNDVPASISYITGVKTVGLTFGAGTDFTGLAAGWNSQSRIIVGNGSSFSVLWPTNTLWLPQDMKDVFNITLGTNFPIQTTDK